MTNAVEILQEAAPTMAERKITEEEHQIIAEVARHIYKTKPTQERLGCFLERAIDDIHPSRPIDIKKVILFIRAINFRTTRSGLPPSEMRPLFDKLYSKSMKRLQQFQEKYYYENPKPQPSPVDIPKSKVEKPHSRQKTTSNIKSEIGPGIQYESPENKRKRHQRIKNNYRNLMTDLKVKATDQELDIMAWMYEGFKQQEISGLLLVSQQAVSKKIIKIRKKLRQVGCMNASKRGYISGERINK